MKRVTALVLVLVSVLASLAYAEGTKEFDHTVLSDANGYGITEWSTWYYNAYYMYETEDEVIQFGIGAGASDYENTTIFMQAWSWYPDDIYGVNKRIINKAVINTDKAVYTVSLSGTEWGASLMLTNSSKEMFESIAETEALSITLETNSGSIKLPISEDDIAMFKEYASYYIKFDLLTYGTYSYEKDPFSWGANDKDFLIKIEKKN